MHKYNLVHKVMTKSTKMHVSFFVQNCIGLLPQEGWIGVQDKSTFDTFFAKCVTISITIDVLIGAVH